jgi:hypothetical protein
MFSMTFGFDCKKYFFPAAISPAESRSSLLSRAQFRHPLKQIFKFQRSTGQRPFRTYPHPANRALTGKTFSRQDPATPEAYTTETPWGAGYLEKPLFLGRKYFGIARDRESGQFARAPISGSNQSLTAIRAASTPAGFA